MRKNRGVKIELDEVINKIIQFNILLTVLIVICSFCIVSPSKVIRNAEGRRQEGRIDIADIEGGYIGEGVGVKNGAKYIGPKTEATAPLMKETGERLERGDRTIIITVTTWCTDCKKMKASLEEAKKRMEKIEGVKVYILSLDDPENRLIYAQRLQYQSNLEQIPTITELKGESQKQYPLYDVKPLRELVEELEVCSECE